MEYQFKDERFMSANDKRKALKAWITFLKNGCRFAHFTDALYRHLISHCSFIAHFNKAGFYDFYFATPGESALAFLDQFDPSRPGVSAELGVNYWLNAATGADLNQAMRHAARPHIEDLRGQFRDRQRQDELSLAARLAAKHGKQVL